MDYEKKYKEALELARVAAFNGHQNLMEGIFPELKESEDKRISKEIIKYLERTVPHHHRDEVLKSKEWIAWLEKQAEQKPTLRERYKNIANSEWFKKTYEGMSISDDEEVNNVNKVEPKFKVGDWITNDACTIQITSIDDRYYWHDNNCVGGDIESVDKEYHLWTIDDAKDGDILVGKIDGDDYILIFKQIKDGWIETYGHYYNTVDRFCAPSQLFCKDYKGAFYPTTKEQRDLLFSKIKEAGYEWDSENLQLTKILHVKELSDGINIDKQKLVEWSEEDERILDALISSLINERFAGRLKFLKGIKISSVIDWLKSLKEKIKGE